MKASIVIPLYNQQEFVAQAIRSALGQTYGDFEVVVVNDGSTDGSRNVAASFGSRIVLVDRPNGGLSEARNTGVRASMGECFLPLDADDWIDPDYLAKTVSKMDDPAIGVVSTDMQYEGLLNNRIPPMGLTLAQEMWANELPVCSLIRRKAFDQTGGYSTALREYEDWNLWIDILKRGWRVAVVNEPLFHYRIKPVSKITGTHGKHAECFAAIKRLHPDLYGPTS